MRTRWLLAGIGVLLGAGCSSPHLMMLDGGVDDDAGLTATGGGMAGTGGGTASGGGTVSTGGGSTSTGGGSAATGGGSPGTDAGFDAGTSDAGVDAGVDAGNYTVRFIALGDTGKANTEQFAVGAAMGTVCNTLGCDFVVLLGDNFYPSGVTSTTDPYWDAGFIQPYAPVNAPFYAVLGNHDYGNNGAGLTIEQGQVEVDYSKVNPKWRMPATHYTFSLGGADFFAADTHRSFKPLPNFDDSQVRADFSNWISKSTAKWKFAFGHHPYLSNGEHGNAGNYDPIGGVIPAPKPINGVYLKAFLDDEVCGKVDFYVCGHDHNIQWLKEKCAGTELIVSGGGASLTKFRSTQDTWFETDTKSGFTYFVVTPGSVVVSMYDSTGAQLYTRTITK